MPDFLFRLTPGPVFARFFAVVSLALVFIWFGGLTLSGASDTAIAGWVNGHSHLKAFTKSNINSATMALGSTQVLIGLLIALHAVPGTAKHYAYMGVVLISFGALSLLFTNPVWMNSLGGFPAIGSGQGIIKYLAIAGLGLWLMGSRQANIIMLLGLILVLGWIGGMKFTAEEANGIYPLLTSSPLFNQVVPLPFGKQMASNVIGAIELVTVLLLTGWWWNKKACQLGLIMAAVTFFITLSFLVTFGPSWTPALGNFPYLSSMGQFLIKDLILLATALALSAELKPHYN